MNKTLKYLYTRSIKSSQRSVTATRADDIIVHFLYGTDHMHINPKNVTSYCKHKFGVAQTVSGFQLYLWMNLWEGRELSLDFKNNICFTCVAFPEIETRRFWGVSVQRATEYRQKLRASDVCCHLITCQTFSPSAGGSPWLHEPPAHTTITLAAVIFSSWDPIGFAASSNRQRCHHPAHALLHLQTALVT